jgi:hypothetical protein
MSECFERLHRKGGVSSGLSQSGRGGMLQGRLLLRSLVAMSTISVCLTVPTITSQQPGGFLPITSRGCVEGRGSVMRLRGGTAPVTTPHSLALDLDQVAAAISR